jgi:hypothetical protein
MIDKWKIAKSLVKYCFSAKKESYFCTELWLVPKNGFILKAQSRENRGCPRGEACPSPPRPNHLGKKPWFVSGGTRTVLFIMSSWSPAKPLMHITIVNKLLIWITHWTKKTWQSDFLHDNAPSHTSKLMKDSLKSIGWDILLPSQ